MPELEKLRRLEKFIDEVPNSAQWIGAEYIIQHSPPPYYKVLFNTHNANVIWARSIDIVIFCINKIMDDPDG